MVSNGAEFDVAAGQMIDVDIASDSGVNMLFLGYQDQDTTQLFNYYFHEINYVDTGISLTFAPVPGPLPLLGAAVAFRASRQSPSRLKASA